MLDFLMIPCLKCGDSMYLDLVSTSAEYSKSIVDILDTSGLLVDDVLPNYLVFKCKKCSFTKKYEIEEIVKKVRDEIVNNVLRVKEKQYISEAVLPSDFKGQEMILCGKCDGLDGNGHCPQSFYNRCLIRRFKLNNV